LPTGGRVFGACALTDWVKVLYIKFLTLSINRAALTPHPTARLAGAGFVDDARIALTPPTRPRAFSAPTDVSVGRSIRSGAVHAPLMSPPFLCGTTPETIPADTPYLSADPGLVELWRREFAQESGAAFRVGIAWQGSVKNLNDRSRAFRLACFAPVARVQGVSTWARGWTSAPARSWTPPRS
jgi:hypothetical protein